jgi:hypothetical protein
MYVTGVSYCGFRAGAVYPAEVWEEVEDGE